MSKRLRAGRTDGRLVRTRAHPAGDPAGYALSVPDRATLLERAERMRSYDGPVLVVWAKEDRLMPREHGRRLAVLFPRGRLVEIDDSYTLIPVDQPGQLAELLREFTSE